MTGGPWSMDPVHESGAWTWSKVGVHAPLVHVLSSPILNGVTPKTSNCLITVWVFTDERKTLKKGRCNVPFELHKGMSKIIITVKK